MSTLLKPDVLARAEALGVKARQIVEGLRVGDHKSPFRGFSVEFVQHREYVPGDDIKHIDWKSYGRSERYTVKQYEQETNFIAHLLVDTSNSMRYGSGVQNKLEYAKLIAASLAFTIIRQRDSVSLRTFDSRLRDELPASSSLPHINAICRTLEEAGAGEKTAIAPLLERLADQVSRRGIVVLISDCFDDPQKLLAGLRQVRFRGHEVCLLHVLHRDEIDFPLDGNIRFVNLEGADWLLARPHLLRPAYKKVVSEFLGDLQRGCENSRIDYALMPTDRHPANALGEYLVRRLQQAGRR
jgi:uncharacterized protein (DUF58 family)